MATGKAPPAIAPATRSAQSGRPTVALPLPSTPLIGRDAELAALARVLATPRTRLLTLTGPPGVGKTRLALAAAAAASDGFADGAAFVDVAMVRDPSALIVEIARVVGVGETPGLPLVERLVGSLAEKELLLVVDNCEHVIEAGPDLAAVVASCPRLRVVATSRERFRLAAEREFPVPPLAMPDRADLGDLERLGANPSVAVLLDRSRALLPDFTLTAQNAEALAEICVRLDGLPLALELAAARLKLFTPGELAARLRQRMLLLTEGARDLPARHRTLRAAISWSHDLLATPERVLFRRLSVFVGGWTLEAAEHLCGEPDVDVLAATASLVDKSLLRRSIRPDQVAELSMLESLREYAAEQLAAHGEVEATRSRHAEYFAGLATRFEAGIGARDETFWWDWLGHGRGNLAAALDHALATGDKRSALRLGAALGWYWYTRGYLGEGQVALDRVLAAARETAAAVPDEDVSGTLVAAGVLAWSSGDLDRAEELLRRSVAISEASTNMHRVAVATAFLGHVARARGRFAEGRVCHQRAGQLFERLGSPRGVAWASYDLGLLERERGDARKAEALLRDSLRRFRDIDYPWAIAWSAWALATVLLRGKRYDETGRLLGEALDRYELVDDRRGIAQCLEALAELASARGSHDTAARLLGAAERLRQALAAPLPPPEREHYERVEVALRRALGADAMDHARQAGRTMPLASAIRLARGAGFQDPGASRAPERSAPLTRRERQVAALVATGRTNRQIGRALGIAEKTAEVHVHHIMGKLGARSRAEVAVWAVSQGLRQPTP